MALSQGLRSSSYTWSSRLDLGIDQWTLIVALASGAVRPIRRWSANLKPFVDGRKFAVDVLNASTFVPFTALVLSLFSSDIWTEVQKGSKLIIAFAGVIGLVFTIRELLR